jgi:lipoprotein-releasing system permease protein
LQIKDFFPLNTEFFLAKRLVSRSKGNFSFTFVVIAITSIALSLAIMFIAVAILTAFKKEIREKVVGFSGHIQVTRFSETNSFEPQPIEGNQPFLKLLRSNDEISHVQAFAAKAGIIKAREHIQGIVLKGVGSDFDWHFFREKMVEGRPFRVIDSIRCDEVIISRKTADMLDLHLHDDLRMYFITGNNTLGRKFKISGIYDTGLEEFDKLYVLGDIHHIQKLNNWISGSVGGFEIFIRDFDNLDRMGVYVYHQVGFNLDATTIKMSYQQIFDWIDLQDINVLIILILVLMVSSTTIISTLLILILERTNMIGILKSLGMKNQGIRQVFLYHGMYITAWGMVWGNGLALIICYLQMKFGIVKLSEESYYMSVIPINIDFLNILIINLGTLVISYSIFLIPSFVISRVMPLKAIRFS